MKKIITSFLLIILGFVSFTSGYSEVHGMTFNEAYVDALCYMSSDFSESNVVIADDDEFGISYLIKEEVVETVTMKTEKNWAGITTETEVLPKVSILTYNYPIMLDTHGEIVVYNGASSSLEELPLAPEMILAGESYQDSLTFSTSESETKSTRVEWGLSYTRSTHIGATIPVNGIPIGASTDSELQAEIDAEYEYTTSITTSSYKSMTTIVDNTPSSAYYQNGDPIFVQFGTRYLFKLQVVVVVEYTYTTSSYTTGSWFSKVTHYTNSVDFIENPTMYKDFEYYTYYSRNHFPFVYTVSTTDGSFELVEELRVNNRYYGD